jgi:hypothetical protein
VWYWKHRKTAQKEKESWRIWRVLTVYATKKNWVSGMLNTRKHNVSESGSVYVCRWQGGAHTLLGPLERAILSHCPTHVT